VGTRNLTVVKLDKEVKVAQYCQWDGYPEGQGAGIVEFLTSEMEPRKFRKNLRASKFISDKKISGKWKRCGAGDSNFVSCEVSDAFLKEYPELHRDTGSKILALIQDKPRELCNSISFGKDGLFCEWSYEINLDRRVLKVFKSGYDNGPVATLKIGKTLKSEWRKYLESRGEE